MMACEKCKEYKRKIEAYEKKVKAYNSQLIENN